MSSWLLEVCKITIGDLIINKKHLISVESSTSISLVLNLLQSENILSIAVYGIQGSWLGSGGINLISNHRQYIGIVSILDILIFILKGNPETVLNHRIVDAIGSSNESLSLWVEPPSRPLYYALEQFSKGTHRALVHDSTDENSPIKMITQTDIVHYLIRHPSTFPHLETLFESPVGLIVNPYVDVVKKTSTMKEAIELLLVHSGVPVIDEDGSIITTLSVSDLRGVTNTSIALFHSQTVEEFLFILTTGGAVREPLMISVNTTIKEAAKIMYRNRVHRLWVEISPDTPHGGVITYTDIIRAIHTAERP